MLLVQRKHAVQHLVLHIHTIAGIQLGRGKGGRGVRMLRGTNPTCFCLLAVFHNILLEVIELPMCKRRSLCQV